MNANIRPSDQATLLGVINPQSVAAAGSASTAWLPANTHLHFLIELLVGAITATGLVDAKLQQATDGSGTGAKDITSKAITQLAAADTDSNKQALLNLRPEELDVNAGFTHFRLLVNVTTAAALLAATVKGLDARYAPHAHAATVDEVIN